MHPASPCLQAEADGLYLLGQAGRMKVDFAAGVLAFRRQHGGGRGQAIARAVGLKGGIRSIRIADLTAGMGRDAFILATLGCEVFAIERHPMIHSLLEDGLQRARADTTVAAELENRLRLVHADSMALLQAWPEGALAAFQPEVLYLDPMHPPRKKSALARKEMRLFREVVGEDLDQVALLQAALRCPVQRVVVKRPQGSQPLAEGVHHALSGRTTRFDIYLPHQG